MITFSSYLSLFTALISLLLGFAVYINNYKKKVNFVFLILTVVLSSWIITNVLSDIAASNVQALFWARCATISASFISLFVYFSLIFPTQQRKVHLLEILAIFVPPFLFLPFIFTPINIVSVQKYSWGTGYVPGGLYYLLSLYVILCVLWTGLNFLLHYRKLNSALERAQVTYFFLGFSLFIFTALISNALLPLVGLSYFSIFGPISGFIFIAGVSYAMVKHRLLDIRLVVARSVAYALLVLILAGIYTSVIFLVSTYLFSADLSGGYILVYALLALFVSFTFQPLKEVLEHLTDSIFFKERYESHILLGQLTKIMASTLRLQELTQGTLRLLLSVMRVSHGTFIIFDDKNNIFFTISEGTSEKVEYDLSFVNELSSRNRLVIFDEEDNQRVKDLMRTFNASVALPLFEDDHKQGLLLLGEKKSGEMYSEQDINLLNIFGPEVSVAIQNAKSYEEIARFNFTLKEEVDKATKGLQEANARLKVLDKLKDEFVSLAAHELRTPMTAIKSYLSLALTEQAKNLNDDLKLYIHRSYISAERLIKLVNNMLNVSRIESGRVGIEVERVEMLSLCQEVLDEVKPRADELGVQVLLDRTTVPSPVMADADKIKEVLINLIGNSLKFTPSGGSVTLSFANKEDMVEIRVKDTGVGIEPGDLFKLFHKFGVLPGSYTKVQSDMGTGLGLYISKSIVEMNEGKMWAESEGKGHGATFIFTLPVFSEERLEKFQEKHRNESKEGIGLEHTQL